MDNLVKVIEDAAKVRNLAPVPELYIWETLGRIESGELSVMMHPWAEESFLEKIHSLAEAQMTQS